MHVCALLYVSSFTCLLCISVCFQHVRICVHNCPEHLSRAHCPKVMTVEMPTCTQPSTQVCISIADLAYPVKFIQSPPSSPPRYALFWTPTSLQHVFPPMFIMRWPSPLLMAGGWLTVQINLFVCFFDCVCVCLSAQLV